MSRKMKDSGIEWIGEIPEDWKQTKLKGLSDVINGYSFKSELYSEEGIRVIRITNVGDGTINDDNPRFYPFSYEHELGNSLLIRNDILMSLTGNVGRVGIIEESLLPAGLNQRVACLRVFSPNIVSKYLFYTFYAKGFEEAAILYSSGTAQLNMSTEWLKNIFIFYPQNSEQQKIVNFLDEKVTEIDHILEKTRESIEEYKNYKQSIITEAVTKGINNDIPLKDSGIEWIGQIPEGFYVVKFGKIATVKSNLVSPTRYGNYIQISPENIEKDSGKLLDCKTVSENGVISDNHLFYKGQILYSKVRPALNKVTLAPFEGLCSADMYPIETTLNSKYLLYYMLSNSFLTQVTMNNNRVKMPKINRKELELIDIVVPEIDTQEAIVNYLDSTCEAVSNQVLTKKKLITELEAYKKSLVYECVTGKREVV